MTPAQRTALQREVQGSARDVLSEIASSIGHDSTERTIRDAAVRGLAKRGLTETWYYDCPALVLAGGRSCQSESGRTYLPDDVEPIGDFNLVTIDVSPCRDGVWGDCARAFYVEGGVAKYSPTDPEFLAGRDLLRDMHESLRSFVTPATTFHDLCEFASERVASAEFETLDFLGNFGHSIATRLEERVFVEQGERRRLSDVDSFTFEPHVRQRGGRWGFKHEDVYRFDANGRIELV